jgi:hypothetical protein
VSTFSHDVKKQKGFWKGKRPWFGNEERLILALALDNEIAKLQAIRKKLL